MNQIKVRMCVCVSVRTAFRGWVVSVSQRTLEPNAKGKLVFLLC